MPPLGLACSEWNPEGHVYPSHCHLQLEQRWVGSCVDMACDQVAVVAVATPPPVFFPGIGAFFHEGDEALDKLLLVVALGFFGGFGFGHCSVGGSAVFEGR